MSLVGLPGVPWSGSGPPGAADGRLRLYYRLTTGGGRRLAAEAARLHANATAALRRLSPAGGLVRGVPTEVVATPRAEQQIDALDRRQSRLLREEPWFPGPGGPHVTTTSSGQP
jgi:hypothetical protein